MLIQDGTDGTVLTNGVGYRVLQEPGMGIIRLDILAEKISESEPESFYSLVMLTEEVEQIIPVLAQALASCLLVAGHRDGADPNALAELATAHDQLAKVRAAGYLLGPDGIPYGPFADTRPTHADETAPPAPGGWCGPSCRYRADEPHPVLPCAERPA